MEATLDNLEDFESKDVELTREAEARITEGIGQAERGEGRDWRQVASELEVELAVVKKPRLLTCAAERELFAIIRKSRDKFGRGTAGRLLRAHDRCIRWD
jgi:hypothetical protein